MARPSPQRLGRYELLERIGQGGMAEVFHARLEGAAGVTKRMVIKRVLPHLAEDPEFIAKFVTEARVGVGMSHPNVVQVFEFGEAGGAHYLAMELVDGQSLAKVLDRALERDIRTLWPATAVSIALHVCRGLHYAHTRPGEDGRPLRLVHRDVSPDNVLVSYDGQVKLSDFGVAKANVKGRSETQPGMVLGKYLYLSPEQARGDPVDARTDVFALGVVLFEMLSGRRPVEGATAPVMLQIASGKIPRLRSVNPTIDVELDEVVARALEVEARARYATAQDFGEALESWRNRAAPSYRERWLQDLMSFLFRPELEATGRASTLSDAALAGVQSLMAPRGAHTTLTALPVAPPDAEVFEKGAPEEEDRQQVTRNFRRVSTARPPAPPAALPPVTVADLPVTAPPRPPPSRDRRRLAGIAAGLVVAAAVVIAAVAHHLTRPRTLDLIVESFPVGARVLIDGVQQEGETPLWVVGLDDRADHEVEVLREGMKPWHRTIAAGSGPLVRLDARLAPVGSPDATPGEIGPPRGR